MAEFLSSGSDIVFIDYIDIIRSPWPKICEFIHQNKADLEEFFNFEDIPTDRRSALAWSLIRENVNGLYDFGTDDYPFDDILLTAEDQIPDLYEDSELLEIGNFIDLIAARKTTKAVYLYTEFYDARIDHDINSHFTEGKIYYAYGEFSDIIEELKPTFFILNDISQVNALLAEHQDIVRDREILLTKHFYNFRIDTSDANYLVPDIDSDLDSDILDKLHVDLNLFRSITMESTAFENENIFSSKDMVYFDEDADDNEDTEINLSEVVEAIKEFEEEYNEIYEEADPEKLSQEMIEINEYLENNTRSYVRVIHGGTNKVDEAVNEKYIMDNEDSGNDNG